MNRTIIETIKESLRTKAENVDSWKRFFPNETAVAVAERRIEKLDLLGE